MRLFVAVIDTGTKGRFLAIPDISKNSFPVTLNLKKSGNFDGSGI
jgi:hypothetical protein